MNDPAEQFRRGNRHAFRQVVEKYQGYVRSTIAFMGVFREDADDIAQEVFVFVYKNIGDFQSGTNFKAWISSIARHQTFSFLRDKAREKKRYTTAMREMLETATSEKEKDKATVDALERLEQCLKKLDPNNRTLLQDRYSGTPMRDLAASIKRSEEALRSLLMRIRKKLRKCMEMDKTSYGGLLKGGKVMLEEANMSTAEEMDLHRIDCLLAMYFQLPQDSDRYICGVMSAVKGVNTSVDLTEKGSSRIKTRLALVCSVAAVLVVGFLVWWNVTAETLTKGDVVQTSTKPETFKMGSSVQVTIEPQSLARVVEENQLYLEKGEVVCSVEKDKMPFSVVTDAGTVSVKGTRFKVQIKGDNKMRNMVVAVITGSVLVTTAFDSQVLMAGEVKEFAAPGAKESKKEESFMDKAKTAIICKLEEYEWLGMAGMERYTVEYSVKFHTPAYRIKGLFGHKVNSLKVYRNASTRAKDAKSYRGPLPGASAENKVVKTNKAALIFERKQRPELFSYNPKQLFEIILLDGDYWKILKQGSVKLPSGEILKFTPPSPLTESEAAKTSDATESKKEESFMDKAKMVMLCKLKQYEWLGMAGMERYSVSYSVQFANPGFMVKGACDVTGNSVKVYRNGSILAKDAGSCRGPLPGASAKNKVVKTDKAALIFERKKRPDVLIFNPKRVFEIILLDEDISTITKNHSVKLPSGEVLKLPPISPAGIYYFDDAAEDTPDTTEEKAAKENPVLTAVRPNSDEVKYVRGGDVFKPVEFTSLKGIDKWLTPAGIKKLGSIDFEKYKVLLFSWLAPPDSRFTYEVSEKDRSVNFYYRRGKLKKTRYFTYIFIIDVNATYKISKKTT